MKYRFRSILWHNTAIKHTVTPDDTVRNPYSRKRKARLSQWILSKKIFSEFLSAFWSPFLHGCLEKHFRLLAEQERPLSRSYRTILPSSLTMNLSSALVFSTWSRVSVYSTDDHYLKLSRFSWQSAYLHYPRNRSIAVLSPFISTGVLHYRYQRIRVSTYYSVSTQQCHLCVAASQLWSVQEY